MARLKNIGASAQATASGVLNKKLPITNITDDIYLINEFDGTNCYLAVGTEKALLIDCGTGFCDLRGACEKITNLPIAVVATHGHVDHIGGAGQFEEIYIHRDDCKAINKLQMSMPMRKAFLSGNSAIKAHGFNSKDVIKPKYKTRLIPIDEGYDFNLGNKIISVKHTPGHTVGSIALIDECDNIVFSGDNVCDALWMQLPGATSLEEWLPSAKWLYDMSKEYRIFWGHRKAELSREYIKNVVSWGEEIIKNNKNSIMPKIKQYPNQSDGIVFRTDKIHIR